MKRIIITALVLVGCSSGIEDRPAPAADDPGTVTTQESAGHRVCTEGDVEPCWHYYHDDKGQLHCRAATHTCIADGYTWSECGVPVPTP